MPSAYAPFLFGYRPLADTPHTLIIIALWKRYIENITASADKFKAWASDTAHITTPNGWALPDGSEIAPTAPWKWKPKAPRKRSVISSMPLKMAILFKSTDVPQMISRPLASIHLGSARVREGNTRYRCSG